MEFEQLQVRVGLDEELELKIARFIKGLSLNITSKVDLQPCLMMCATQLSKLRSNLRVENPFKPLPLFSLKVPQGLLLSHQS